MRKLVYALRDNKANFLTPSFEINEGTAIRALQNALYDDKSILYTHAKDFDLYKIGEYDDESGFLTEQTPVFVVSMNTLKENLKNE